MKDTIEISVAIVLFKDDPAIVKSVIECLLKIPLSKKLYLIDNSPTNLLEKHVQNPSIDYRYIGRNMGFGKAHNTIIEEISNYSNYHLILNSDVVFDPESISTLIDELKKDTNLALIAPRVNYPTGGLQATCRKNPTFLELFYRRFRIKKEFTQLQEYRDRDFTKALYPDFVHGCFMLFKTNDFVNVGGFDKRYFLYMEDADICRKIKYSGKEIVYHPSVQITHLHGRGSAKKIKLLFHHLASAIQYFEKWNK